MREAWITLLCPDCETEWDGDPAELPAPGNEYRCEHCGATRPVVEFVKTQEGLEIHRTFHGSDRDRR